MSDGYVNRDCIFFRIEGFSTISGENDTCTRPLVKGPGWVTPLRGGECKDCPFAREEAGDE